MILNHFHVQTSNLHLTPGGGIKNATKLPSNHVLKTIQKTFATIQYINTPAKTLASHSNLLLKIPVILSTASKKNHRFCRF